MKRRDGTPIDPDDWEIDLINRIVDVISAARKPDGSTIPLIEAADVLHNVAKSCLETHNENEARRERNGLN